MKRVLMSILLGLVVVAVFSAPVTAGLFDPNSPPPSTSRYEYPIPHDNYNEGGWADPHQKPAFVNNPEGTQIPKSHAPTGHKNGLTALLHWLSIHILGMVRGLE